jgi:hypothetical protein
MKKEETDEVEPVRGSLEHERRWGHDATEVESCGGLSSVQEQRTPRENSGVRGKGAGCSTGGAHPFIGAGGGRGGGMGW